MSGRPCSTWPHWVDWAVKPQHKQTNMSGRVVHPPAETLVSLALTSWFLTGGFLPHFNILSRFRSWGILSSIAFFFCFLSSPGRHWHDWNTCLLTGFIAYTKNVSKDIVHPRYDTVRFKAKTMRQSSHVVCKLKKYELYKIMTFYVICRPDKSFFYQKSLDIFYVSRKTYSATFLMSTYKLCFHGEIRKIIFWILRLSGLW